MRNLDKLKQARSDYEAAKMLSFKAAQIICGNLNDQEHSDSSDRFREVRGNFEKEFLEWFKAEEG